MKRNIALTIGGHDPSGGAGVGADLVTFCVLGAHGAAVVTAVTYQNTRGVRGFTTVDARQFTSQLETVLEDMPVAAVKVGMVAAPRVATALEPFLARWRADVVPVVVDPVFRAGGGQPLFEGVLDKSFLEALLANASLFTPNALELGYLLDEEPAAVVGDLRTQARVFYSRYKTPLVATGGHVSGDDVADVFFNGSEMREFRRPRLAGEIHGTGCLLAAAVTAYLAGGADVPAAVERAEEYVTAALTGAYAIGEGARVPDRAAATFDDAERWRVYANLVRAVKVFETAGNAPKLVPEVGANVVYCSPGARTVAEVCGIPGRIIRVEGTVRAFAAPAFGASSHMARALLVAHKADGGVRAAMNVRGGEDVLAACRELNLRIGAFDRAEEPPAAAAAEGKTLEWGMERAIAAAGGVPDVVYDRGAFGKEPMIRLFGPDAFEVVRRAVAVSRRLV